MTKLFIILVLAVSSALGPCPKKQAKAKEKAQKTAQSKQANFAHLDILK